jgi:hypothetical protein
MVALSEGAASGVYGSLVEGFKSVKCSSRKGLGFYAMITFPVFKKSKFEFVNKKGIEG